MFFARLFAVLLFGFSIQANAAFMRCADVMRAEVPLEYDYIVVGAGAAGAPLASRLAQKGHRVLVLEAGGPTQPIESQVPALHAAASENMPVALDYGVSHYADPTQAERDSKHDASLAGGILYPRGEGLGGSALVNAGITVVPHRGDFDRIGQTLNDPYWSDETMWRLWRERIEDCRYHPVRRALHRVGQFTGIRSLQNLGGHGFDGWLQTTRPRLSLMASILWNDRQLRQIILTAERENRSRVGGFLSYLRRLVSGFDPNDRRSVDAREAGLVITPLAVDTNGRRNGVRNLLLNTETEFPDRLHIATNVVVGKVIFDSTKGPLRRAVGIEVEFRDNGLGADDEAPGESGGRARFYALNDVIISAGAFETPALLMRSGIGPQSTLEAHGIEVVVPNDEVGRNLHDRYEVGVVSELANPIAILNGARFAADPADPFFQQWQQGRGLYTTNGSVIAFTARSNPSLVQPDLYIFGLGAGFRGYEQGYSSSIVRDPKAFTWAVLVAKTQNRAGVVTLSSSSPGDAPKIDFNYFGAEDEATPTDLAATAAGVKIVRELNARMPEGLFAREVSPGSEANTSVAIEQWIRDEAWGHHATGTARLGAVVDGHFRVMGTSGLRVVDASVFPDIPGFFLASAVYIVAEMGAERILGDGE